MRKTMMLVLLAALLLPGTLVGAATVKGVAFPDSATIGGRECRLNGVGVRKKVVISVYLGALYLGTPTGDAAAAGAGAVADAPGPATPEAELAGLTDRLPYLTPMSKFGGFVREKPPPYDLSAEKLREVGLDRETWRLATAPAAGQYHLCCRTIDANGIAQPLPRPLPKSGSNAIQRLPLIVEA